MALIVNGEYLDEDSIHQECEMIRQRLAQEMPEESALSRDLKAREWATDNVIERVLLHQAARQHSAGASLSEARSATIAPGSETAEVDGASLQKLLAHVTRNVVKPKKKEVMEIYEKNKALFLTPESAHASHIVKNVDEQTTEPMALEIMQTVQAQLKEGRPFAEVADKYSDCPGSGGDLGWFSRGEMVEEFESVVFRLQPGGLSEIFRSPFGYHVAVLHERKPAGVRPLNEVYNQVEEMILGAKRQLLIDQFLDDLRSKADVQRVPSRKPDLP